MVGMLEIVLDSVTIAGIVERSVDSESKGVMKKVKAAMVRVRASAHSLPPSCAGFLPLRSPSCHRPFGVSLPFDVAVRRRRACLLASRLQAVSKDDVIRTWLVEQTTAKLNMTMPSTPPTPRRRGTIFGGGAVQEECVISLSFTLCLSLSLSLSRTHLYACPLPHGGPLHRHAPSL
jgi:hypothetical protein